MLIKLSSIITLLVLISCSAKQTKTSFVVSTSSLFGGTAGIQQYTEGGLMIWGSNDKGEKFATTINDSNSKKMELPNGKWTFYAMAWDNSNSIQLDGSVDVRCAETAPTDLAGDNLAIPINLNVANCETANFKGLSPVATSSSAVSFRFCESVEYVSTATDLCTDDRTDLNRKSDKAPVMSARVRLKSFSTVPGVAVEASLTSTCLALPANPSGDTTLLPGLRLPAGNNTSTPFLTELEVYVGSMSCDTSGLAPRGFNLITLPNGLNSNSAKTKYLGSAALPGHILALQISDEEICNSRTDYTMAGHPFAGGDGTTGHPYIICSAAQLLSMTASTSYLTKSFRLATDINLNPYSSGLGAYASQLASIVPDSVHWNLGQNFQPIGLTYSGSTAVDGNSNPFNGNIDGNDHIISNLRINYDSTDNIGFISVATTTTATSKLWDLQFVSPDVSGRSNIGSIIGSKTGPFPLILDNIRVTKASVESKNSNFGNYVGSIAGQLTQATLTNIYSTRVNVSSVGSYVGGIAGSLDTSNSVSGIYTNGFVTSIPSSTTASGIGGLFGKINNISSFNKASFEGAIITNLTNIGGIVGETTGSNAISNFYANAAITAYGTGDNKVGGVAGSVSAITLNYGYFSGHISDDCVLGASCNRGFIKAQGTTTGSALYNLDVGLPPSGNGDVGTGVTELAVSTSAIYTPSIAGLNSSPWIHVTGDLPRLIDQYHPCTINNNYRSTLATQKANGQGSTANPLVICRLDQFLELSSINNAYVRVGGAVNLMSDDNSVAQSQNINANVTLDGDGGLLYGLKIMAGGGESASLIDTNNGTIKKLVLANMEMVGLIDHDGVLAGLAHTNNGTIENVTHLSGLISNSSSDSTNSQVAGLIYDNYGTIKRGNFFGKIKTDFNVAGIAYVNQPSGVIQYAETGFSLTPMSNTPTAAARFYGLVGTNYGLLELSTVNSVFSATSPIAEIDEMAFVVGKNTTTGVIKDIHVHKSNKWFSKFSTTATNVAQIAIINEGTIKRVINQGKLLNLENATVTYTDDNAKMIANDISMQSFGNISTMPAGRLVLNDTNTFNCTYGGSVMNGLSPINSPFSTDMNGVLAGNNKVYWAIFEINGVSKMSYLASGVPATPTLTMAELCDTVSASASARLTIIQDYNTSTVAATNSGGQNQLITDESRLANSADTMYSGVWQESGVLGTSTDVVNAYSQLFQGSYPASIPRWSIESKGISIFDIEN